MATYQKTAVITGASSGIGRATALALAKEGWRIIATGRDKDRSDSALADLKAAAPNADIAMLRADLSLLSEADRLASEIAALTDRVNLLVNNAGGMAAEISVTAEGLEGNFTGNYLAPFLMTQKLLPLLEAAAADAPAGQVRIINTSSDGSEMIPGIDPDGMDAMDKLPVGGVYCSGKLANVLHARALALKLANKGISAHSFHPGTVGSNFFSHTSKDVQARYSASDFLSVEDGADTLIWLVENPAALDKSGGYWHKRALREPNPVANDDTFVLRFWDATQALISRSMGR